MTRQDWIKAYEAACNAIDNLDAVCAASMGRSELAGYKDAAYRPLARLRDAAWAGVNDTWES
jgi:hypothetical protein